MFTLHAVSKNLAGTHVLRGIDLVVPRGQTTVLIGPSGSGKSTLLGIMTGLLKPDSGEVQFDGKAVAKDDWPAIRTRLGYVIQDGGLFPHLTARQNISIMARQLGWSEARTSERIAELKELTKLSAEILERYPAEMSGGQRQRVALMRALMLDAPVLLLDEPLGALDPMIRADLQADLTQIFARLHKTVVLVTHDLHEAVQFAHQMVLLRDGQIVQCGTPTDFHDRPADPYVTHFIRAQRSGHPATVSAPLTDF